MLVTLVLAAAAAVDPAASELVSVVAPVPPCSCDCCGTIERSPAEQTETLKLKCAAPAVDLQTEMCPASCAPSEADTVITSASGSMDYPRFCQYKCKPAASSVGSMCIRLSATETQSTQDTDGNGNPNSPVYGAADGGAGSGLASWEQDANNRQADQDAADASANAAADMNAHLHYDVSQVMQNRLRAETAAAVARASAAEARAKADLAGADRAALSAEQAENVQAFATAGSEAAVEAQAVARQAAADARDAAATLAEVKTFAKTVAQEAAKDAVVEIKKQAAKAAKELADTHAKMWGWDKPENWPRIEAIRAGNPYQAQMAVANQRMAEYEGYSKDEMAKAAGDQAKTFPLATQANAMEAQGNKLAAANTRHEIDGILASAKGHQAKAQSDWDVANTMRHSIPQWQDAAMKASVYAAWKYSNVFTPPPGMAFLQAQRGGTSPTASPR